MSPGHTLMSPDIIHCPEDIGCMSTDIRKKCFLDVCQAGCSLYAQRGKVGHISYNVVPIHIFKLYEQFTFPRCADGEIVTFKFVPTSYFHSMSVGQSRMSKLLSTSSIKIVRWTCCVCPADKR